MTRPTRFSDKERDAILGDATLMKTLKALYGETVVFNSSNEMALVHNMDCRRALLNGIKDASKQRFTKTIEPLFPLIQKFHGWNDKRLPRARRLGAGPPGHGWASVRIAATRRAKEEAKAKRAAAKAKAS